MWSNCLVFCDYGFTVSALWCPLATPTILLGFLLPWTCGISSWLLQQSATAAPHLGRGRPSWPWMWNSSSLPSCTRAAAAPDLWHGVAPLVPSCTIAAWCSRSPPLMLGIIRHIRIQNKKLKKEISFLKDHPYRWVFAKGQRNKDIKGRGTLGTDV